MEFVDNYEHKESEVFYFSRSMPTGESEKLYNYDLKGCACQSKCEPDECTCILRSGTFYKFEDLSDLEGYHVHEKPRKSPTYECNNNCTCENICGNKLVQFGPRKNLEVKKCEDKRKGYGLFTKKGLLAGNFVCEYAGEVIAGNEAKQRYETYQMQKRMNYIYCIKETFGDKVEKTYIDPTVYGNIGRYINHSCDPNCDLIVVREDSTMPTLGIFAHKNIPEDSELSYDYGKSTDDSEFREKKPCYCGSEKCNKFLPLDTSV